MLRRYTWEKEKEKLQHYRRRTPEASVLYQLIYHYRDDLQFLGVVGQAPPPIPKFIDTALAIDASPSYDSFEPSPDDF